MTPTRRATRWCTPTPQKWFATASSERRVHSNRGLPSSSADQLSSGALPQGFKLDSGQHDEVDTRVVVYGIRYIVENFLEKRWTMADVELAAHFYSTHGALGAEFPFPRHLFEKFVLENDGFFPVTLQAVPEGTVVHANVPVYQVRVRWSMDVGCLNN